MTISEFSRKRWQEKLASLRPLDDILMKQMFKDDVHFSENVLRILLENRSLRIVEVLTEHTIDLRPIRARSLCLDVLATDDAGKKYNIEVQRDSRGANRWRARYHASILDADCVKPSDDLDEGMPEVHVIFITEHDVYGRGFPMYHVDSTIRELGEPFGEGRHILYVNTEFRGDNEVGKLAHDFCCSDPDAMLLPFMAERTRSLKLSEKGASNMTSLMEEFAREERLENSKEIAVRMYKKKFSLADIAECSGLSEAQILESVKEAEAAAAK